MVERVSIGSNETAAAIRAAQEYKGRGTGGGSDHSGMHSGGASASLVRNTVIDGTLSTVGNDPVVASGGVHRAQATLVKDGTVDLGNGMVTSIEAALANGWIAQNTDGSYRLTDSDFAPEQQQRQQQQQAKVSADEIELQQTQLIFEKADSLISSMSSSIPTEHREALMEGAILGDIDGLSYALGEGPVSTLVEAYSRQADMIASEQLGFKVAGIADIASEVMSDEELAFMREGLLSGNRHAVKQAVAMAYGALDDTSRSEGLLQDLEAQGARVTRHADGKATIRLPNGVEGSVASLLRSGFISWA